MVNFFQHAMNPTWYHGHGKKPPYFEGWYYKLVSADEKHRFAIIPGVFINEDSKKTHSFIQVLNGNTGESYYHKFGSFEAEKNDFKVRVDRSHFSEERISLDIDDADGVVQGELTFTNLTPIPTNLLNPGIMGWYSWVPNMECNHGVISMGHEINGTLTINGEEIDFTGGHGYMEKDWGESFPNSYIWMQSNHFETENVSLSASIATIPFMGRKFAGFIVALMVGDKLYRFATYNNSKVDVLTVNDNTVTWSMHNGDYALDIVATRTEGGLLKGPERHEMGKRVEETMQATVSVTLSTLDGFRKTPLFSDEGRNMGLEVVGDLGMLLK